MLILALDTSTAATTAELVEVRGGGGEPVDVGTGADGVQVVPRASHRVVDARGHGEQLAPAIAAVLAEAMVVPSDLDAVVVGTGPGPYTGLRVGLVTAAVLADTLAIPAHGVCSLDGLVGPDSPRRLLVATDARRREVYWAEYTDGERVAGPDVARPAELELAADLEAATGAGARLYAEAIGLPCVGEDHPSGLALVRRALPRLLDGAAPDPLTPLYLRRPDAVVPGPAKAVTP